MNQMSSNNNETHKSNSRNNDIIRWLNAVVFTSWFLTKTATKPHNEVHTKNDIFTTFSSCKCKLFRTCFILQRLADFKLTLYLDFGALLSSSWSSSRSAFVSLSAKQLLHSPSDMGCPTSAFFTTLTQALHGDMEWDLNILRSVDPLLMDYLADLQPLEAWVMEVECLEWEEWLEEYLHCPCWVVLEEQVCLTVLMLDTLSQVCCQGSITS